MAHRTKRDFGFFQWTIVGFMLAFGLVGIVIVWPLLVLGLVLLGVVIGRSPRWPASLGGLAGIGIAALVIVAVRGQFSGAWTGSGVGLIAASATTFWWLRCRPTAE